MAHGDDIDRRRACCSCCVPGLADASPSPAYAGHRISTQLTPARPKLGIPAETLTRQLDNTSTIGEDVVMRESRRGRCAPRRRECADCLVVTPARACDQKTGDTLSVQYASCKRRVTLSKGSFDVRPFPGRLFALVRARLPCNCPPPASTACLASRARPAASLTTRPLTTSAANASTHPRDRCRPRALRPQTGFSSPHRSPPCCPA